MCVTPRSVGRFSSSHLRSVKSKSAGDGAGIVVTAPAGAPPPPSAGGTYVRPGAYIVPARACG